MFGSADSAQTRSRSLGPDAHPEKPARPDRPFGVTLLTIGFGFSAGLLPILSAIGLFIRGEAALGLGTVLSLVLAGAIVFAAIGAFQGNDASRLLFTLLVTIHYSIQAFNKLIVAVDQTIPQEAQLNAYGAALRKGLWVLIVTGYFLRPKTIRFYRHQRKS